MWEAPGVEIPFISISRCFQPHYYKEYHTSFDDLSITNEQKLHDALNVLESMIDIFERDATVTRCFTGLVALSNPKYDLYVERPEPTVDKKLSEEQLVLGRVQDLLPRYFNGKMSIFEISMILSVPFEQLLKHLCRFEQKGLVRFAPIPSLSWYERPTP